MLNLTRYVQCHFRHLRSRHKRVIVAVFLLFLLYFWLSTPPGDGGQVPITHDWRPRFISSPRSSDSVVALKSQVGYLRNKISRLSLGSGSGVLDVNDKSQPIVYVVTPTYARDVQKAELTRLCHTFLLVPNLHWIVVEDAKARTRLVSDFLSKGCGVTYTHLHAHTPADLKLQPEDKRWRKPRGVFQRNEALHWLRANAQADASSPGGVIYFADDDNVYSLELFDEMRKTKRVSVWPVGLVGGLMVERPRVDLETEKVIGWDVVWAPQRPFAIDMAGFAVNLQLFLERTKAKFAYEVKRGYQESEFLKHLATLDELEPRADLCQKVLVWHTRTERTNLDMERKLKERRKEPSNAGIEV